MRKLMATLAILGLLLMPGSVFAQEPDPEQITLSNLDRMDHLVSAMRVLVERVYEGQVTQDGVAVTLDAGEKADLQDKYLAHKAELQALFQELP